MKKKLAGATLALSLLAGCSAVDHANNRRGRGDAPVGAIDRSRKEVIEFPDRFSNVSHACDGHGHRVYVTTKSDGSRAMFVSPDPSCQK